MIKKIILILVLVSNLLFLSYLLSPTPSLPPLANSAISNLPGDTVQVSNVSGFFTNQTRQQVINFYKANYTGPFRIILNHPPEKAREVIVDTIPSYYFEEFILPFKETLYINGYEWQNDVFTKLENRLKNKLIYDSKEYFSKITIRRFPVSIKNRLVNFFIVEAGILAIISIYYIKVFKKNAS
ncbi:MAG: hypothetical protein WCV93_02570 [Candidatus Shapirobacteria bacterium]|jgi:hypothetical protein